MKVMKMMERLILTSRMMNKTKNKMAMMTKLQTLVN